MVLCGVSAGNRRWICATAAPPQLAAAQRLLDPGMGSLMWSILNRGAILVKPLSPANHGVVAIKTGVRVQFLWPSGRGWTRSQAHVRRNRTLTRVLHHLHPRRRGQPHARAHRSGRPTRHHRPHLHLRQPRPDRRLRGCGDQRQRHLRVGPHRAYDRRDHRRPRAHLHLGRPRPTAATR